MIEYTNTVITEEVLEVIKKGLADGAVNVKIMYCNIQDIVFNELVSLLCGAPIQFLTLIGIGIINRLSHESDEIYNNGLIRICNMCPLCFLHFHNNGSSRDSVLVCNAIVNSTIQKLIATCLYNKEEIDILSNSRRIIEVCNHDPKQLIRIVEQNRRRITKIRNVCYAILRCRAYHNIYRISTYKDLLRLIARAVWSMRYI